MEIPGAGAKSRCQSLRKTVFGVEKGGWGLRVQEFWGLGVLDLRVGV